MKHVRNALRSAILALSLAFMALTPQAAYAAPSTKQSSSVLVQGTTAALSGLLEVTHFTTQNNQLVATGVLNGTVTSAPEPFPNIPMLPLNRGGADAPGNMQWQRKADAKAKDAVE